jgi:hypothetical protein
VSRRSRRAGSPPESPSNKSLESNSHRVEAGDIRILVAWQKRRERESRPIFHSLRQ